MDRKYKGGDDKGSPHRLCSAPPTLREVSNETLVEPTRNLLHAEVRYSDPDMADQLHC